MEKTLLSWPQATRNIYIAVMIFAIGEIAVKVVDSIVGLINITYMNTGGPEQINLFNFFTYASHAAIATGYALYMIWLGRLKFLISREDWIQISRIRIAAILLFVSVVLCPLFPPRWLLGLMDISAYIIMFLGFSQLQKSTSMSTKAKKGFSLLYNAMMLNLVSSGLMIIFGWMWRHGFKAAFIIVGILVIVSFCMMINGWKNVKDSHAPTL